MPDDKSEGSQRKIERRRVFLELLRELPLSDVLVIRALMFVKKRGRIFKSIEPIVLGSSKKKERKP